MSPGRLRPARPWSPMFGSAAVVAGWWLVAHSSGQGWVQVLGDLVFAALAVGVLGPALATRRIRITVVEAPADSGAGQPATLTVACNGRARIRPVHPEGPEQMIGSGRDQLQLSPRRRGVHLRIVLDLASSAPFGLQWWTRRVAVELPEPMHVAPRLGAAARTHDDATEPSIDGGGRRRNGPTGDLRAPRPYRPGDARNRVHWPATAHTGELMVRELEAPHRPPTILTVELPVDDELAAERLAEDALATVSVLLDDGRQVVLVTDESGRRVTEAVVSTRQAGRRLARAGWP